MERKAELDHRGMAWKILLVLTISLASLADFATAGLKICSVIQDDKTKGLKVVDGDHKPMVAQATFAEDQFNKTGYVFNFDASLAFHFKKDSLKLTNTCAEDGIAKN